MELEGFGVDFVDKRAMWAEAVQETVKMMCMNPYPGFQGKYFSMPHRNVVPKPLQKPHPSIWAACSNRDSMNLAAHLGMGALTFAFVSPEEAKFWIEEYYETFKRKCTPIGQSVNPNVAMLTGFMCHEDNETAIRRGHRRVREREGTGALSAVPRHRPRRSRRSGKAATTPRQADTG